MHDFILVEGFFLLNMSEATVFKYSSLFNYLEIMQTKIVIETERFVKCYEYRPKHSSKEVGSIYKSVAV